MSCELFDMSDQEVEPCGLIQIPKLGKKVKEQEMEDAIDSLEEEDVFDLLDEDMEHDDSDWC